MKVQSILAMCLAITTAITSGWIARGFWAYDRCLDAGGAWIDAVDGCDLPNPAVLSARAQLPIVKDAMLRWAAKDVLTVEKAIRGRTIEMVSLPDKECVSFGLGDFDVGGVPTYCYRRNTTQLVFEDSDVE